MNWFDIVTTTGALTTFLYMGYEVFITHRLMSRIEQGREIPQELVDFPIYQATVGEYEKTRSKIEEFKSAVLQGGRDTQIILSQSDINTLYSQGITINKFLPGVYRFFSLKDESVVVDTIEYPSPGVPNAIWCQTSTIKFEIDKTTTKPIVLQQTVRERGISFHSEPFFTSLEKTAFILLILDASANYEQLLKTRKASDPELLTVIERIRTIEIISNELLVVAN